MMTSRFDVTLPIKLISELKKSIPKTKRSSFVAKAVEEKLALIKQEKAFGELKGVWDKTKGAKFFTQRELSSWRNSLWSSFEKKLSKNE